ncbi:hypothetical protein [Inquilinus sp. CAU 1745]|uniref:hypothetical protein n=1 Tax=Inquilinus sp. CAU 1745 TaxID=3140369 RepID=UPI00325BE6EC
MISLLSEQGYWTDATAWRHYGDVENNWGQSGNQQSLAEAALAEKVVNSVDATLIGKCRQAGIDPESSEAPQSIRAAVSKFYDVGSDKMASGGKILDWTPDKRREVAETITLSATGASRQMSLTISDMGEGQMPDRVPETILSLNRSNKMRIPFVQGQFNQGGTGALRFAGKNNLQLVVSRRNPAFVGANASARDHEWGFTLVRRERPSQTNSRNSIYTFLAPIDVRKGRDGVILTFAAEDFGIFPNQDSAYGRQAPHGTAIKLYEYNFIGERSNILRGKSLFSRLDLLLPRIALPVRVYEMRPRRNGHLLPVGSRETTLDGLVRRLGESSNLEPGFPVHVPFSPMGERLTASVYAGRKAGSSPEEDDDGDSDDSRRKVGGLKRYRKREGVIFTRNGQTQGTLPKEFFQRPGVKMKPIAEDLLVFVDCDGLSADTREDLFMASRDRLVDGTFKAAVVRELEIALANCDELKELRNQRQQQELEDKIKDDKPLSQVLESLIDKSPNLRQLLRLGTRIQTPLRIVPNEVDTSKPPKLEAYPTYFTLRGAKDEQPFKKSCPINQRSRFTFDTDVRDDYFVRDERERGSFTCLSADGSPISFAGPNLRSGVATITVSLPDEVRVGDVFRLIFTVKDEFREFINEAEIRVMPPAEKAEPRTSRPRKEGEKREGEGPDGPSGLNPPLIEKIYQDDWAEKGFDESTAMHVQSAGYDEDGKEIRMFLVNMDNASLLHEAVQKKMHVELARNQFLYANVLFGLALLLDESKRSHATLGEGPTEMEPETVEHLIARTTKALAPFMLAIASLGAFDLIDGMEVDGLEDVA